MRTPLSWSWLLEASIQTQFAKILTRYFAGDATMAEEQEEPEVISHLQLQKVSFDDFKPGSTVLVLMEQPPLIHAIDLAVFVTGKDENQSAEAIEMRWAHMGSNGGRVKETHGIKWG